MSFEELSPELRVKVKACKTPEEILALAKEEGHSLSDEELEAISAGGEDWCKRYGKCSEVCFPNYH